MMRHPRSVMTFSDAGAHVSQIADASIQTHLLGHWVRNEQALPLAEAVHMITAVPAAAWGFADRGSLAEGMVADINIFDPDTVGPEVPTLRSDLPGGGIRLIQRASGFRATLVGGQVTFRDGGADRGAAGPFDQGSPRHRVRPERRGNFPRWMSISADPFVSRASHHSLRRNVMKYMLLIYSDPGTDPQDQGQGEKLMEKYMAFNDTSPTPASWSSGEPLQGTDTATWVRVRDGKTTTTDGPFAETKEYLGGYYLVEVKDLDRALELAAQIPGAHTGVVEVRPLMEFGGQERRPAWV